MRGLVRKTNLQRCKNQHWTSVYQTCTNIENVYLSSSSSDTYWGLSATCDSLSRIEIQATCANANRSIRIFLLISWFNAAN